MKKVMLVLAAAALLAGCNTIEGFGKDMQRVGEKVEESAKRK